MNGKGRQNNTGIKWAAFVLSLAAAFALGLPIGNAIVKATSKTELPDSDVEVVLPKEEISEYKPSDNEPEAEKTPSPVFTPSPNPKLETNMQRAQEILSGMSIEEKVFQMFIVYPLEFNAETKVGSNTGELISSMPVGGIVFSAKSLQSSEQTQALCAGLQSLSEIGLIIAADEEGGRVERLMSKLGTTRLEAMFEYKDQGFQTAYDNAYVLAEDLLANGLNTNFAPVTDVWSNPENEVIGDRAYSDDFEQASLLVAAAVRGFSDGGVISTLKHFPGHGDTVTDTHTEKALISKSLDALRAEELLPFASGIKAGADMVMIGHMTIEAISDEPSTVSRGVITGLLREEMAFDGVIISDSLKMGAVAEYGDARVCVLAVQAGMDILLGPANLAAAANGILKAIENGELTQERIDESVYRILLMKLNHGIIS